MAQEIEVIDSQRLNMIQMCGYKYDLTFNRQYTPVITQSFFEEGRLMHHMLEQYYKLKMYEGRWHSNKHTFDMIVAICIRVGEHFAVKMNLSIEVIDDNIRVFREYTQHYRHETFITLAVEQVGSRIMYEDDDFVLLYETKMDWIVRMKNVELIPWDHKTSHRRGETLAISNQFIGYCWMLNVRNLGVNKIGFQKTVKPADKFTRTVLSYTLPVIEGWVQNTIYWVKQYRIYKRTGFWPQNFTSCDKYAGCIYKSLCESAPETREFKAARLFDIREEPWDVGKALR